MNCEEVCHFGRPAVSKNFGRLAGRKQNLLSVVIAGFRHQAHSEITEIYSPLAKSLLV
jgi:hypothetical protein